MRLVSAELLKLRRRWATYIVLAVLLVLMAIVYFFVGQSGTGAAIAIRFPAGYQQINSFVFGLGSLLAVAYTAAVAGADWSWGIFGTVVARGESRSRYVLAKFVGLAIVLALGVLIAYAVGMALTFGAGAMAGINVGQPFASGPIGDLARSLGYGYLVIAHRGRFRHRR